MPRWKEEDAAVLFRQGRRNRASLSRENCGYSWREGWCGRREHWQTGSRVLGDGASRCRFKPIGLLGRMLGAAVLIGLGMLGGGAAEVACTGGTPCVLGEGTDSWARADVIQTAVGCIREFRVTFGSVYDSLDPRSNAVAVNLCQRNPARQCVVKIPVEITPSVMDCCSNAIQDRTCRGLSEIEIQSPVGLSKCTDLKISRTAGRAIATVRFVAPYMMDLTNNGENELCLIASELTIANTTITSAPYCVPMQLHRCSACLAKGEGINTLSKEYGTHWSQMYSSNHDIVGSPDKLEEGRLLRLGPMYQVQAGETMMSIALKFGVTVNQLFFWNKHLGYQVLTAPPVAQNLDVIAEGDLLCLLPKTCHRTFSINQPIFDQRELYPGIEGGSWSDPYQVPPTVYKNADTRPLDATNPTMP